jgi:O-antigen ligase
MAQIRLVARLNQFITRPLATAPGRYHALGIILGVLGLGVLAAALYLAPQTATLALVLLGLGLPIVLLLWRWPEFGLLALIFLTSGFVSPDSIDVRLPIGGGLDLRDLVLLGMFGLMVFRGLVHKTVPIPWWPVGALLLVFLSFAALSAGYALFFQGVEPNWALSELRDLSFYAVFFLTAWTLKEQRQLTIVVVGLCVLAGMTAGILVLQQFLGKNRLLASMLGTDWQINEVFSSSEFGAVRVIPPGNMLMFFMMSIALCIMVFTRDNRRLRVFALLQFVFLSFALVLTYTRAQWIATIIVFGLVLIVFISMHRRQLAWYVTLGTATLLLAVSLGGFFAADLQQRLERIPLVSGILDRTADSFESSDNLEISSLEWRGFEAEQAWRSLSKQPLLGVGLGNSYRDITLLRGEARGYKGSLAKGTYTRFTRYAHSSYVYIAVKMGLPALIFFLTFCAVFLVKSWQLFRALPDGPPKDIVLAVVAGFIGLLVWTTIHSDFMKTSSVAVVGLVVGLVAAIHHVYMDSSEYSVAVVK